MTTVHIPGPHTKQGVMNSSWMQYLSAGLCLLSFRSYSSPVPLTRLSPKVQTLCSGMKEALEAENYLSHCETSQVIPHFLVFGNTGDGIWILTFSFLSFNDLKWDSSLVILKSIQKWDLSMSEVFLSQQIWFRAWKIPYAL